MTRQPRLRLPRMALALVPWVLLAGCATQTPPAALPPSAAAVPAAPVAPADIAPPVAQPQPSRTAVAAPPLVVKGALAAKGLGQGSAVVEVRDVSTPDGAVVAESRVPLATSPKPTAFVMEVPRDRLAPGKSFAVQGAILQGAAATWITRPVPIDPRQAGPVDVGTLALEPFQAKANARDLQCGSQKINMGFLQDRMLVTLSNGKTLELAEVPSEQGTRFAVLDDPQTTVTTIDDRTVLVLKGRAYPDCVAVSAAPAAKAARGPAKKRTP